MEILYQPFYAYEEVLATFGDKPNQTNSLLASIERLTGYVTAGDVTQLVPPDEQERRAVLLEYARRKPTPETVGGESAAGEFWFYLSYAGGDLDENVERFYKDLSAEVRRLQGLGDEVIGCLPRRPPSPGVEDLDRAERALLNSRVLVPLYSPAYFTSEQCARELNFFSLLGGEQPDGANPPGEGAAQILPVSWIPPDPLPPGVERYGPPFNIESREYPSEGLSYLMRLQRHEDDYQAFVRRFARALVKRAEARVPRPIMPRTSLRDAPTSFADSEPGAMFISYSAKDRASARVIADYLRREEGVRVLDGESLPRGRSPLEALDDALRQASRVLILLGAGGMDSWQKREVVFALQRQEEEGGRSTRVIPVLLPGAEDESVKAFPTLPTRVDLRDILHDPEAPARLSLALHAERPVAPSQLSDLACPYPGLRAFTEEESQLFFGREALLQEITERLKGLNLAAIIGYVGSGKTSVVKAGLLPMLRRQRPPEPVWEALVFTPGDDPLRRLAAGLLALRGGGELNVTDNAPALGEALARGAIQINDLVRPVLRETGADRLLIVVDQFEELFTMTVSEELRRAFTSTIFDFRKDSSVSVLLTARAEFYSRLLAFDREAGGRVDFILGSMSREEVRRAVENPARLANLRFQPGLVERILDDFNDEPDGLPALEATLHHLWQMRESDLLTHQAYQDIGGIGGAVAAVAEGHLARMSPPERDAVLRVLARMVNIQSAAAGQGLTRQRLKLSELSAAELEVLVRLSNARLVTVVRDPQSGEDWAELAFDALLLKWQRLRAFIDKDRDFLLWRQAVRAKINDWERAGKSHAALLTDLDVREAELYLERRGTDLSEDERAYIESSSERAQKLSRRRRLGALGMTAATAAITLAAAYWQFVYIRPATSQVLLAGRVVNANTQQPVSRARVTLETEGVPQVIYTDSNGLFLRQLPGSTKSVRAEVDAESYQAYKMTLPTGSGVVDIQLQPAVASRPSIQITTVPAFGRGGPASSTLIDGHVDAGNPEDFRVVIYAYTNKWYVQPETTSPLVDINLDGTWAAQIHQGTKYAILLVRPTFKPAAATNSSPDKLSDEIIDSRILENNR